MGIRKILLVVNPTGGVRNGLEILENIKPIFEAGGIELEIIETKYAGHAKANWINSGWNRKFLNA
jgi:diacylglycerol kinase family enzyme